MTYLVGKASVSVGKDGYDQTIDMAVVRSAKRVLLHEDVLVAEHDANSRNQHFHIQVLGTNHAIGGEKRNAAAPTRNPVQ